jgi:coenzyme F420 hydrogenase subunit beta
LKRSPTVDRVEKGELCSGCGLCAGVSAGAIKIEALAPGYNRPVTVGQVLVSAERKIASACPGAVVAPWSGEQVDEYWGPWRSVLTGHATDETVRFEGSSGGVITALLVHALSAGLVEGVIHIAPDPRYPARNMTAISHTPEEVIARAGSRYAASSPLEAIDDCLASGKRFVFVGKPCDVSALRRLASIDERVDRQVPLMISFFCGGVPSHAGADRILSAMGIEPSAVTDFRYRGRGWPGNCVASGPTARGQMTYAESWGSHLSKEVQFRCKICPDAVGGAADIACADAWHGDDDGYPSFAEEPGRSLIVSRTEAGEGLLASALASRVLEVQPASVGDIERMQPAQARRKRLVLARTAALPLTLQPRPRMDGLGVAAAARRASPREALQNLVGTLRRVLQGRRSRL